MIAAEKWYENQARYRKYGLDMKPVENRVKEERPKTAALSVSGKDRLCMLLATVLLGAVFVGFIAATAYSAKIQYDINRLNSESNVILGEIENLNVNIKTASNIQIIEEKAVSRLGMVYPQMRSVVFISGETEPNKDFALALKQQAYN